MVDHYVKAPFMSRPGQFEPGKQTLCVGIDKSLAEKTNGFRIFLGKNKKVCYIISALDVLTIGQLWKNPKGIEVMIIPIDKCDKHDT